MFRATVYLFIIYLVSADFLAFPDGSWKLKSSFAGSPSDWEQDHGKSKIESWFSVHTDDETNGFPGAYKNEPGGPNLFIDKQGYLVIQPTCPTQLSNGQCRAYQCGDAMVNGQICQCNNETIDNGWFPWWCQLEWGSAKINSQQTFNINAKGGLFVFEDTYIPRGKPLWPAIWLLPDTNPYYGGNGSPKGGDWSTWPNNGEIDILEAIGDDPRIFGTLHYTSGDDYSGWPGIRVTYNNSAVVGSAYKGNVTGNILALRSSGNNPLPSDGHLETLCFMWYVDAEKGPTFAWFVSNGNPVSPNGDFKYTDQLDVMINRIGTNPISKISGDGTGALSFGTTPYWPGSLVNSPPLTLYKGWDGKESYGFQGYYKVQGNVKSASVGIHNGAVSSNNPNGLGIVPKFDSNGKIINGTIDELYEPYLCSMMGDWGSPEFLPLPWSNTPCQNPPPGYSKDACPRTGVGSPNGYDFCMVEGASKPGVGWWSNSPMAAGNSFAPFDPNQNWNIVLNVAIGGSWPRGAGQEGVPPGQNYDDMAQTNLKIKSINYYEID